MNERDRKPCRQVQSKLLAAFRARRTSVGSCGGMEGSGDDSDAVCERRDAVRHVRGRTDRSCRTSTIEPAPARCFVVF
jgi:hypothetical protein